MALGLGGIALGKKIMKKERYTLDSYRAHNDALAKKLAESETEHMIRVERLRFRLAQLEARNRERGL